MALLQARQRVHQNRPLVLIVNQMMMHNPALLHRRAAALVVNSFHTSLMTIFLWA